MVALDLDGTLVDSAPDTADCLGVALEGLGLAAPGETRTRAWIADGLEAMIEGSVAHALRKEASGSSTPPGRYIQDLRETVRAAFLECYRRRLFVRSRLYPGVISTLDVLRARRIRISCITNKYQALAEELLRRAGVLDRFELLLGGDSLPEMKPSPLPLITAAKRLGVACAEAALVGDSRQDLDAATGAGFKFVLASYGYGKVDEAAVAGIPSIRQFCELQSLLA